MAVKERICKACGKKFVPISYTGKGSTSRRYCYDPKCEEKREKERRQKVRSRQRLKESVERRRKRAEKEKEDGDAR